MHNLAKEGKILSNMSDVQELSPTSVELQEEIKGTQLSLASNSAAWCLGVQLSLLSFRTG